MSSCPLGSGSIDRKSQCTDRKAYCKALFPTSCVTLDRSFDFPGSGHLKVLSDLCEDFLKDAYVKACSKLQGLAEM